MKYISKINSATSLLEINNLIYQKSRYMIISKLLEHPRGLGFRELMRKCEFKSFKRVKEYLNFLEEYGLVVITEDNNKKISVLNKERYDYYRLQHALLANPEFMKKLKR